MIEKKSSSVKNIQPSFAYLIEKKREKEEFTDSEVRYIVESVLNNTIPSHQLAALIMTIYFQGLSAQETAVLAEEVMLSGEVVDLTNIGKPKISLYCAIRFIAMVQSRIHNISKVCLWKWNHTVCNFCRLTFFT